MVAVLRHPVVTPDGFGNKKIPALPGFLNIKVCFLLSIL